jgi:hypothetical protein
MGTFGGLETVMLVRRVLRPAVAGALILCGMSVAAKPVAESGLAALGLIEHGQWTLQERGQDGPGRSICLTDPRTLLQIRHAGAQCSRFVIENGPKASTIHYTCAGQGHGRTTVTVETPRLLTVETQGVAQGAPFAVEYEARRTGACTGATGTH